MGVSPRNFVEWVWSGRRLWATANPLILIKRGIEGGGGRGGGVGWQLREHGQLCIDSVDFYSTCTNSIDCSVRLSFEW